MRIILGSSSPRRIQIMRSITRDFSVIAPEIDEKKFQQTSAQARTMAIAKAKGQAIAARIKGPAVIVTADTVVQMPDGVIREKPSSIPELQSWLLSYRDQVPYCATSIYVLRTDDGSDAIAVDGARIKFRPFEAGRIEAIIADSTAMGCAGGFTMEHPLFADRIDQVWGDPECIQGLPGRIVRIHLALYAQ